MVKEDGKLKNLPQNVEEKIGARGEWWVYSNLHFLSLQEEIEVFKEENDDNGVK